MLAQGFFLGPPERRAFVWEHRPSQPVPLAVVICPPLGYHYACAYPTLRVLAEQLAGRGHVVLRVEYHGTSNAAGTHLDPDRIEAWSASVGDAIDHAIARGAREVCLVGLGFGATLAVKVAATHPAASRLVLWDPVVSGRRLTRELAGLAMATGETQPEPGGPSAVSVVGHRYTTQTLDAMKGVDATRCGLSDRAVLIVERPERDGLESLTESLQESGCEVTARKIEGTAALLDTDAELARIPEPIVDEIVRWITGAKAEAVPASSAPAIASNPTADTAVDAGCHEEFERVGPMQLAGMWGRPPESAGTACVIFLNNGVSPSTGPARAWVDMSRELNRRGWSTLRLDMSGLGDSPTRRGMHDNDTHARVVTDDISDVMDAGRARGFEQFFLVGLCSGAFNALEAQYADDRVTACFALNPALWVTPRRRTCWFAPWWRPFDWAMRKTPIRVRVLRLPRGVWRTLAALRITPPSDITARKIARLGRHTTMVFFDDDPGLVDFDRRSSRPRDRYRRPGSTVEVVVIEPLDHSMFGYGAREKVLAHLSDWLDASGVEPIGRAWSVVGEQGSTAV